MGLRCQLPHKSDLLNVNHNLQRQLLSYCHFNFAIGIQIIALAIIFDPLEGVVLLNSNY